eukprot:3503734-Rhodomonas_salina.1
MRVPRKLEGKRGGERQRKSAGEKRGGNRMGGGVCRLWGTITWKRILTEGGPGAWREDVLSSSVTGAAMRPTPALGGHDGDPEQAPANRAAGLPEERKRE